MKNIQINLFFIKILLINIFLHSHLINAGLLHNSSNFEVIRWVSSTSLKLSKLKGFNDPSYNIFLWTAAAFIKDTCDNPECLKVTCSFLEREITNILEREITSFEMQDGIDSDILSSNFKIKYIRHDAQCSSSCANSPISLCENFDEILKQLCR
jgi:hypothetical protein